MKFEAEGREFAKSLRSHEQFVKGQNNFLVTECFSTSSWRCLISNELEQLNSNWKKRGI